jgi:4-amino-4-deoxy-L-arabinose transferase-like glycosyltransferase
MILLIVGMSLPVFMMPTGLIWLDGATYLLSASDILNGNEGGQGIPYGRTPLFPAMIALAFLLGGPTLEMAGLVVKLSIVLCALGTYGVGRLLHGRSAGLIAVATMLAAPYFVYFVRDVKLDGMSAGLMVVSLALFVAAQRLGARGAGKQVYAALSLSGFCLGLAVLVKETALVWFPLPLIMLLASRRSDWPKRTWCMVLFYGTFGLAVSWWFFSYYRETGRVYLLEVEASRLDLLMVGTGFTLLCGLALAYHWLQPIRRHRLEDSLHDLLPPFLTSGKSAALLVLIVFIAILTIALVPTGQPIASVQDVINRF